MNVYAAITAVTLSGITALSCAQAVEPPASEINGMWFSHSEFGPELGGEVVISQSSASWRLQVGSSQIESNSLDFVYPDGSEFHGEPSTNGKVISGWWKQPPGPSGQAYATPVRLGGSIGEEWSGSIVPLAQDFHLFLSLFNTDDGAWLAAFRNPEYNINGGRSRFQVSREGKTLSFSTSEGEVWHSAVISDAGQRLQLEWPPLPSPIEMARATETDLAGYYPRLPETYRYKQPERTDDGWRTGKAKTGGMDEKMLAALVQSIIDSDPADARPQLIHSLLIAHKGRLVLEEYFHGYDRKTPHDTRSAGKTFSSVLLGAVMFEGAPIGPESRIVEFLQPSAPSQDDDQRKNDITLAQLMTHTSGLECNDNDGDSLGNEGTLQSQTEQPDWWRYTIDLPMVHAPGERYAYCSAGMNLVGAALNAATDETIYRLFDRVIAKPLQFGRYHWNLMPNDDGYLGGGAHILPRDLLKVGQLYLDGGVWNGRRIVSEEWVEKSTSALIEINEATTGMDEETFANNAIHGADGLAWHRYPILVDGVATNSYEAGGNGGQLIIVAPDYDLVVVFTGGNYGQGGIWSRWRNTFVGEKIIPAIR